MATQAVLAACRAKRLPSLLATSVHGFLPENLQELGHASLQLHKLPDTGRCSRHCDKKPCLTLLAGGINNTKGNGPVLLQLPPRTFNDFPVFLWSIWTPQEENKELL